MPRPSMDDFSLKISYLNLHSNLPGVHELSKYCPGKIAGVFNRFHVLLMAVSSSHGDNTAWSVNTLRGLFATFYKEWYICSVGDPSLCL